MAGAHIIREGSTRVRIFRNASGPYIRHEIRWTDHHGKPHRLKRSNPTLARAEARRIAQDLARGHHHAELSLADLASFRLARQHLYGTGKTIEQACADYAEARRLLKSAVAASRQSAADLPSLPDLARHWLATRPKTQDTLSVASAIEACLTARKQAGHSPRWLGTLKSQLTRFEADHPGDIAQLTASAVQHWFLHLVAAPRKSAANNRRPPDRRAQDLGPRSRNNHLAAVQLLFQTPALRHHPERAAILDLTPCAVPSADNQLWTPAEFHRLLLNASHSSHSHLLPVLVLGGFCKLRASEIQRVTWDRLRLDDARLLLKSADTKTGRWRIVPLPDCAVAWLRLCERRTAGGAVWEWGTCKFNKDLRALAASCQLRWRPNALRNSAVTYDQILNPNLERVAREAGNTPAILETEYLALQGVTLADAKAWFDLFPPASTQVIVPLTAQK